MNIQSHQSVRNLNISPLFNECESHSSVTSVFLKSVGNENFTVGIIEVPTPNIFLLSFNLMDEYLSLACANIKELESLWLEICLKRSWV